MTQARPSVLLVENVDADLVALRAMFDDLGCDLVCERSGDRALEQLAKGEFAVMLLDVQAPHVDAYQVARDARGNPSTRDLPIIFLTTAMHDTEDSGLHGYEAGAVDFLYKPVNALRTAVLRGRIRVFLDLWIERRRSADRIEAHQRTVTELAQALEHANLALVRATAETAAARLEAENASRFRSQFVAKTSHELRTPLSAILGFAEILHEGLGGEQKEFAGHIQQSGKRLLSLMVDLLALSTIEPGPGEPRQGS
jgi:CheY-like chemotaxis protein